MNEIQNRNQKKGFGYWVIGIYLEFGIWLLGFD
jgi:hypothetical protein